MITSSSTIARRMGGYDASLSYLVPPSTLETIDGKFPVDALHFVESSERAAAEMAVCDPAGTGR